MVKNICIILMLFSTVCRAQFKADNVKYKTVFPEDLCQTLAANKGYLLLDVRSPGEYDDTSSSSSLNIGHLKNAVNINITQLPQRWREVSAYKDQPVFIYCSHSQRSRRASRLLADSGFTKVFNINGGLTDFYNQGIESTPCTSFAIETAVPYKIIGAGELTSAKALKSYYIIDLRSDSVFRGISNERSKHEGRFCDAVNIPFEKFMAGVPIDSKKPILLVDEFGDDSPKAAKMLIDKGVKGVTILFDGMFGYVDYAINTESKIAPGCGTPPDYSFLSGNQFAQIAAQPDLAIIDVRSKEEFTNVSKNYWQNIGQVRNAINIPAAELKTSTALPASKSAKVVVYGFNGQNEIFESAKWLRDQGYKDVSILYGGIWRLRWVSHNIKGQTRLNDLVVNVPADNE